MIIKFNKFERVAGLFVVFALGGVLVSGVVIAVKKGWFERKAELKTEFDSAMGLNPGTQVQMAGIRVGSVESVEIVTDSKIEVTFSVPLRHLEKIRQDSVVRTIRPFLIGDKVLDVSVGSKESPPVAVGSRVPSESSMDVMDLLGGRQLGSALKEMGSLMTSLRTLLQAFDQKRAERLIELFDQMLPLVINANTMAIEMGQMGHSVNRKKNIQKIVDNLAVATETLNKAMPQIAEAIEASPHMAKDMSAIVANLSLLTTEMNKVLPALAAVAPDLPRASKRAIEAMDEAVIVLKAMEKSFLLKGSVEDVRAEEAKLKAKSDKEEAERVPASGQK